MGAFAEQRKQRQENVPLYWKGDFDGDTITGKVLGAGEIENSFKPGEMIPAVTLLHDGREVRIEATRKALANLIYDLDPEAGDHITIKRTGTKANKKNPTFQPTVLFEGANHGKTAPAKIENGDLDSPPF